MILRDAATAKDIWLNNYFMTLTPGATFDSLQVVGRYYDHDRGYVDTTTPVIYQLDATGVPESGTM